jgi:type IX secretion system PorP/SprF family membrane protein
MLPLLIYGQDIHFSQTVRAGYQINPAFIGCFAGNIKAELNWKDQWQSLDKSFKTYGTSFEFSFGKRGYKPPTIFFALGGHVFKDVSGDIQLGNTSAGGTFSTLIKVNQNARFVLGVQGSYSSIGINPQEMQWGNQYNGLNFDPSLSNGEGVDFAPFHTGDVSVGIAYWYHKKNRNFFAKSPSNAKIGLSAYHLNRPEYNFGTSDSRLPIRFVLHGDAIFTLNESTYWYPNFNVMYQNKQHEILLGSLWKYNIKQNTNFTGFKKELSISAGADIRITNIFDAIIPQIYLGIQNFSVGLSYDINVSKLNTATSYRGGFEFSLRFINSDGYYHKNPFKPSASI